MSTASAVHVDAIAEETRLAAFAQAFPRERIPEAAVEVVRHILLAVAGTAIAGASEDGCKPLREMLADRGGKPECTVFVYGDRLPATSAALLNGVMCRALDFCDAMVPGLHIGSSLVPAALAAAELNGGCKGSDFVAALTVGAELAARLNRSEADYDGFDPTGVAGVFAATAAAARVLGLDEAQMRNALALAFNRCGGSFQSNVDGSLAVRLIQGWVAESGVHCALLARSGLTGPARFLSGVYGYEHLFSRGRGIVGHADRGLGEEFLLQRAVFKKYPSCGLTQGVTELALQVAAEADWTSQRIRRVEVRLPPYAHRLVGHPFAIGENPRVNAQFSAQYCVASALLRKASKLRHFRPEEIRDPDVRAVIGRIEVTADPAMEGRGHTAVDLAVEAVDGTRYARSLDVAPGFPGRPLTGAEHRSRFDECIDYAAIALPPAQAGRLVEAIGALDELDDVRLLAKLMVASGAAAPEGAR
ncbi:MAG: MmgE/PrpD family protein [Burkholderiales bacterium]|nr:MmgE/PrpD family protein [Burkholderiales bacterium]OJX07296.1 MAG: MmgE/PrpD family protein [Burkholderiales bacterium 70-64]